MTIQKSGVKFEGAKPAREYVRPSNKGEVKNEIVDIDLKSSEPGAIESAIGSGDLNVADLYRGDAGKIKADLEGQMKEITGLLGKSADVVKGAKSIPNKMDSGKAVKAINTGTKALNATQKAIPGQLEQIKAQDSKK